MKERIYRVLKDKVFLLLLMAGLLTAIAAVGVISFQKGDTKDKEQMPQTEQQIENKYGLEEKAPSQTKPAGQVAKETTKAAEESVPDRIDIANAGKIAGDSDATEEEAPAQAADSGLQAAQNITLNFLDTSKLSWPVAGNVILDYSMETTTYFPTLEQWKCNPAILIQSEVSTPILSAYDAKVKQIGQNEEIGNFVVLEFGNDYTATVGQMKEVQVLEGEYIKKGSVLGYVAEPTKYYSVEGNNVYFELRHEDRPVDPLDYLE